MLAFCTHFLDLCTITKICPVKYSGSYKHVYGLYPNFPEYQTSPEQTKLKQIKQLPLFPENSNKQDRFFTMDHLDILIVLKNFFQIPVYVNCVVEVDYRLALEIFKNLNKST